MSYLNEDLKVYNDDELRGDICLKRFNNGAVMGLSSEYQIINNNIAIQFMCFDVSTCNSSGKINCTTVLISFRKLNIEDKTKYILRFSSKELGCDCHLVTSQRKWETIRDGQKNLHKFDVCAIVEEIAPRSDISQLHEDTELTDFEMKGVDGSVCVHRAVIAAASPVLRRMLSGEWREATSGIVEVPGTTRETLQHFKDYVYLSKLPKSGLRPLLLLATYYMVHDLKDYCVYGLADQLTADTTCDLLEFAISNKLTKLMVEILVRVKRGDVEFPDIRAAAKT